MYNVPCEKPLVRLPTVEVISTNYIDIDVFHMYWTNNTNKIGNTKYEIPIATFKQQDRTNH